ncbi:unnamed protein product [Moneuplotes crassus]|uniref:HEAT repeat-containing protein 1 n=2 Tax=Euplotes crassus TaxID=5936 RepID=A0AAD2CZT9_EUPCR|nr:unnamed protein product [Moneuplotes crassus]
MSTALARQLQGLKSSQKDAPVISSKARVSFLFDFKEAYKVDEEVIYTLCIKGLDELSTDFPQVKNQLDQYREDIFDETSKDFYRGGQNKETLELIDTKISHIITILSPYFLKNPTYKILEFLIRIYEVHAHHKLHLFFSFLPFYDTPQFLRLLKCMELKNDYMLSFFQPFVSKGVILRQEALVKFMARENGAYLKNFSDITFKFLTLQDEQSLYLTSAENEQAGVLTSHLADLSIKDSTEHIPHFRFWGTLVFKIITNEQASRSDSFLYVLIPYIAKALDSKIKELQIGALTAILGSLDVSMVEKKIPFSEQYMNAFLTEICKSASYSINSSDDVDYYNLCCKTCLRILDAQQIIERLNERLSMYSYNSNTSKYQIDQTNEDINQEELSSYKWIGDLLTHQIEFITFLRNNSESDLSPLLYKCMEFYTRNGQEGEESSRNMIKILATLNPNQQEYKIVMSYLFAIIADHLPECKGEKQAKFSVLILDYLENKDSFTYVQVLNQLLQGRSEKHKILEKIEDIELEQLGKFKKKVVSIETGSSKKESIPVLLALYHRKDQVKKAALLQLYQQWVQQNDIYEGKDSRMIISMLIQFIEDRQSQDILIVTFSILEKLLENEKLSSQLIKQLYNTLSSHFIPKEFLLDRQYSLDTYMRGVNLFMQLQNPEFENLQIIIYVLCNLYEDSRKLLVDSRFKKYVTKDQDIKDDSISLNQGLELLKILITRPDISNLLEGKIWTTFEAFFNNILKKAQTDPFLSCLSLLDTLKSNKLRYNPEKVKNIVSLFLGKLPSLSNTDRKVKERLSVSDVLTQSMKVNSQLIPTIFETICIKHLNCDLLSIIDYFTVLYHESKESHEIRVSSLAFVKRVLDHSSDLNQRTAILENYFPTFLVALSDENSDCRRISLSIMKIYENYESFSKVLKKDPKNPTSIFSFLVNKSKTFSIKKGKSLDKLEEFIEDVANHHETEIMTESGSIQNIIDTGRLPVLFDYLLYAISTSRTPFELGSYIQFLKNQRFSPKQMEDFCNVLVSIEFKSSILSKEMTFQYMPNLIDILCFQNTDQNEILDQVHDSLCGILDQYNSKIFDLPSQHILKANKKLVEITTQAAQKQDNQEGSEFALQKLDSVIEVLHNCIKNPESPDFYLRLQVITLLESLPEAFYPIILTKKEKEMTKTICYEPENFSKMSLVFESLQSVSLSPSNLPHLISLIHKLGEVISEMGVSADDREKSDPIQILVVLINLTQSTIDNPKYIPEVLDEESKQQVNEFIKQLVSLFVTLLADLTEVYQENSKIKEPENMIDPVEEFLAKDSLMTSAQKEREEKGIEDEEEDSKPQNDIILYQGLSNLLLLISGLQSKVDIDSKSLTRKIYTSISSSLEIVKETDGEDGYLIEVTKSNLRKLLTLQSAAFTRIVLGSLSKSTEKLSQEHNKYTNKSLEIYLHDISTYSESLLSKTSLLTTMIQKVPSNFQSKLYSLTITLLLKLISNNPKIAFHPKETSAKIFEIENEEFILAQKILYKMMNHESCIPILTNTIMVINHLSTFVMSELHQKSKEFVDKKTEHLFDKEFTNQILVDSEWLEGTIKDQRSLTKLKYLFLVLLEDILPQQGHTEKYGEDRHPLVRYFHNCVEGEITEEVVHEVTNLILAFDFGTTLIEHQLHLISDHKKDKKSTILDEMNAKKEKKALKKVTKSVERLVEGYRKFNQDFVSTLIPLKLYVPVVTNIIGYSDKLILLKTRSMNTLSEVVMRGVHNISSDLHEAIEGGQEKTKYIDNHRVDSQLHSQFKDLIKRTSEILETYSRNHKSKEIQTYLQSILLLLQKILSFKNQEEIQTLILPQVFVIAQHGTNTMLCCSAIMFVTSAFDLYKVDLYQLKEDLVNEILINLSLKYIRRVLPGGSEENDYYASSVIVSILDSYIILLKTVFNQLLTPEQLSEILEVFFSIPENKGIGDSPINSQIDLISSLVAKHITPQISLHAQFNIFEFICTKPEKYNTTEQRLNVYTSRYFMSISKVFRNLKKEFIEEYHEGISKFFHKAFLIPQTWEKNTHTALTDVSGIHNSVLGAFKTFILKLNEVQLKPLFTKLVKWACKPIGPKNSKPLNDLDRLFIFFKTINCLLETLMSIFPSYLSYYINIMTELLEEALEDNHSNSLIMFMPDFNSPDNTRLSLIMVIDTLLETIRLNYYFDTESTIPSEYFDKISASFLHIMDFYIAKGAMDKEQYIAWIKNKYQKVIVDVLDSLDNQEITKNFLDDLLQKSKHSLPIVRLASLKITEALVYKLEERFLTLLSDVFPYISEALEDANEDVETTARNIVQKIESMTGESIKEYLK